MRRQGLIAILAVAAAGCGVAGHGSRDQTVPGALVLHGKPQAVDPVAGAASPAGAPTSAAQAPAQVSVSQSGGALAQPISIEQVRQQLSTSGISANPDQATLAPGGLAIAPVDAPAEVQAIINAGNQIARLPYVWGGGHVTYEDTGYDCSGSLSFVLAAAGLLRGTVTSGELVRYGASGPGRWVTIFANAGHTFAYIAGLRFDTVALAETGSRWSNRSADESNLHTFAVRHPPGL